jgi:hypothetical protein
MKVEGIIIYIKKNYSLRPILLSANTNVSITKICLDRSIVAKSNMDRRNRIFETSNY